MGSGKQYIHIEINWLHTSVGIYRLVWCLTSQASGLIWF